MSKKKLAAIITACTVVIIVVTVLIMSPPWRPPITPVMYTLSIDVDPPQAGSVSPNGGEYESGVHVTLIASPASGYTFDHWSGNVSTIADINAATTTITINGHYSISANFAPEILEIRDWYDLDAIRDNLDGSYVLMNDLDSSTAGYMELASETANWGWGWKSMGNYTHRFVGVIDGQGYEIRDLFINRPDGSYAGLFGAIDDQGIISNMRVVNATLKGGHYVGSLVGHSRGTVSDSWTTGMVTGVTYDDSDVGGLVGNNEGTVSNSYSTGRVRGNGDVGGLVGNNLGTVSNSYSTATVTGHSHVGGLVGFNDDGTVSESYASGNVSGYEDVGGLVGFSFYGTVSNSYSTGSVSGRREVGGLVGNHYGDTVSRSFWDTETSGQATSAGGTVKTTVEMKNLATFSGAGWDIVAVTDPSKRNSSHIWNIVDGVTYPFLSW